MQDVAVIGSMTIDENFIAGRRLRKLGGVVSYAGLTYRQHGATVLIISNLSPEDNDLARRLELRGLDVHGGESDTTTSIRNHILGDQRKQHLISAARPIVRGSLPRNLSQARLIHLGPIHANDVDISVLSTLKELDVPVVLDMQGYVRRIVGTRIVLGVHPVLRDALSIATIAKAELLELQTILKAWDISIQVLMTKFKLRELIVTQGRAGGTVYSQSDGAFVYRAEPVKKVKDSTGAGDVFFSSYCYSRVLKRHRIAYSSHRAARIAAMQVAGNHIKTEVLTLK